MPPEQLATVWPAVLPWISEAVERNQGDENIWDVLIAISRGLYFLWYVPGKFAAVVQVMRYPRQTVATILYLGGVDLVAKGVATTALKEAFDFGKLWCLQNGINVIRTWGRKGWERALDMERKGVILQAVVK